MLAWRECVHWLTLSSFKWGSCPAANVITRWVNQRRELFSHCRRFWPLFRGWRGKCNFLQTEPLGCWKPDKVLACSQGDRIIRCPVKQKRPISWTLFLITTAGWELLRVVKVLDITKTAFSLMEYHSSTMSSSQCSPRTTSESEVSEQRRVLCIQPRAWEHITYVTPDQQCLNAQTNTKARNKKGW